MRICITISPIDKKITIPKQYNYIIQSMILNWINDKNFSSFIHDTGYSYENRKYKLYCFSKLFGKTTYSSDKKLITFEENLKLYICSPIDEFINYLINTGLLNSDELRLWNQIVRVENIEIIEEPDISSKCNVYTLSPITVYSTFNNEFGKKTYYYTPQEADFYKLIKKNIIKKYVAFYGNEPIDETFEIENINNINKQKIIIYKGNYIIKAYEGKFLIRGNPELIKLAYNSGLSNKNAQGLGMIEIEERRCGK